MSPRVISRKDAKAAGLKRYFTGKPCCHGHVCTRNTASGGCQMCARRLSRQNYRRYSTKKKKQARDSWHRRAANPDFRQSWNASRRAFYHRRFIDDPVFREDKRRRGRLAYLRMSAALQLIRKISKRKPALQQILGELDDLA